MDTEKDCPFHVVDGQHRLEGLKIAAKDDARVLDFEMPVNIAIRFDNTFQMCQFLVVNATQKVVDKGIEQWIISRLTDVWETENMPTLPIWITKRYKIGEDRKALRLVRYLNETDGSPWHHRVQMANEARKGTYINQRTFVNAVVKQVLKAGNPLARADVLQAEKVFLNYWKALRNILDEDGKSIYLYKSVGVYVFCQFSTPFFKRIRLQGQKFTVEVMEDLLSQCFKNMEGEYAGLGEPLYWHKGGPIGQFSGNIQKNLYSTLAESLKMGEGIQL